MKFTKFLVGIGFVISLGSLGGNWYLYEQSQTEKSNSQKLESNLVQLGEQNSSFKHQLAEAEQYKEENERLRTQIKDYVGQRDTLKKEVDSANAKAGDLQKQIQKLEAEKKDLQNELSLAKATDSAMVQEATKLPVVPDLADPSVAVPAVSSQKTPGVKMVPVDKKMIPFVVRPELPKKEEKSQAAALPPAQPVKSVEDKRPQQVLTVNRQFNFVVVNVGLRDKIKIGDVLRVEQKGKLIGRVQVEKLYENFSACAVMEEIKPAQIHEGDLVRIA